MRKLSEEEKAFTSELVRLSKSSYNVFISNVVDRELNNIDVFLNYKNKEIEYRFDQIMYDKNPADFLVFVRDFSWKMIKYFHLLTYFEKNGMLFLYQEGPIQSSSRFGRLIKNNEYVTHLLNDPDAVDLILEYSRKTILINHSLLEYVEQGFITEEDTKHQQSIQLSEENLRVANESLAASEKSLKASEKSLHKANVTIVITIGIFFIGTLINLYIAFRTPEPIKLNPYQMRDLKATQIQVIQELKNIRERK